MAVMPSSNGGGGRDAEWGGRGPLVWRWGPCSGVDLWSGEEGGGRGEDGGAVPLG